MLVKPWDEVIDVRKCIKSYIAYVASTWDPFSIGLWMHNSRKALEEGVYVIWDGELFLSRDGEVDQILEGDGGLGFHCENISLWPGLDEECLAANYTAAVCTQDPWKLLSITSSSFQQRRFSSNNKTGFQSFQENLTMKFMVGSFPRFPCS